MGKTRRTTRRRQITERLYFEQGRRCYLCGRYMFHPFKNDRPCGLRRLAYKRDKATFDHLWPRAITGAGCGTTGMIGAMAHAFCNSRKGYRKPRPCEALYVEALLLRVGDAFGPYDAPAALSALSV